MNRDHRFTENLPQLAAQAADVAKKLCGTCQSYHLLWPYLRLIGVPGGIEGGESDLNSAIAHAVTNGRRDILIAGAADTGLLSVVARATVGLETNITVLDRCETPLELCRRFASRWALKVGALHTDLREFSVQSSFDIVVAHHLLTFIAPNDRFDVMSRLRRSLRPDGRLILRFRAISHGEIKNTSTDNNGLPERAIAELDKMNIALPEPREDLRNRIAAYVMERHSREDAERDRAEVEGLLDSAGFIIESIAPIPVLSDPFGHFSSRTSKLRYLLVAAPR